VTSLPSSPPIALVVDLYRQDVGGRPDWGPLVADDRYVGVILKATDGVRYPTDWFASQWPAVRAAAGARYGASFVRGAYHYLRFADDPAAQAHFFLDTVAAAGGWDHGDLVPIVDVERGREGGGNAVATAAQVVDATSAFVAAIKQATGQAVMVYGRGAMRDLGITSRFGADYLWNPSYTAAMVSAAHEGWPDDVVVLWQFTDGTVNHTRYPTRAPGLGAVDASLVRASDLADLRAKVGWRVTDGGASGGGAAQAPTGATPTGATPTGATP
jgi:GH25 family lysozyme M1 (1,4-beta-N-acetylmuramidase)